MKLWKIAIVLSVFVSSCSIQQKPKIQITHVLAVTQEGDTLKIPIDLIRPVNYRIINYGYGYDYGWSRPYYMYDYYRNYNYSTYSNSGRSYSNGQSNKGSDNNKKIPDRAFNKPTPPPSVKNETIKVPE